MKRHWSMTVLTCCCLALLSPSRNQKQQPAPDTRAADEATIREADSAWSAVLEGARDFIACSPITLLMPQSSHRTPPLLLDWRQFASRWCRTLPPRTGL